MDVNGILWNYWIGVFVQLKVPKLICWDIGGKSGYCGLKIKP